MKISSGIKKIYTHFYMVKDKEGHVCCNQDYSPFRTTTDMFDT